jgi:hypothetical protein
MDFSKLAGAAVFSCPPQFQERLIDLLMALGRAVLDRDAQQLAMSNAITAADIHTVLRALRRLNKLNDRKAYCDAALVRFKDEMLVWFKEEHMRTCEDCQMALSMAKAFRPTGVHAPEHWTN